jgi:hypothetical protein
LLGREAARLSAHLTPIGNAEAAVPQRSKHNPISADRWSIQLGAFHVETAARKTVRAAASLPVARGKPSQIVESGKSLKARLYRARLLDFTPREAENACIALHKERIDCTVIPPPLRIANR